MTRPADVLDDSTLPPPEWAPRRGSGVPWVFGGLLVVLVAGRLWVAPRLDAAALDAWTTVFVAICVQALPFLVFGVALSAAITAFVPARVWTRVLPARPAAAVPVAGALGAVLPGCECASVPVAGGLMARGVTPAAALTFLLAAPAINPVVLVATAIAFPGSPSMVAARFGASLLVAVLAGWTWALFGRGLRVPPRPEAHGGAARWDAFRQAMRHDLMHAGGFLVVGGIAAATINVVVPAGWVAGVAGVPVVSVLTLAVLAVLMSICSEADAFVAASLTQFSPTAKLAFLVVGPMVDLKLIALQAGFFGRRFALRFVPLTFVLAVTVSLVVGEVFL
ncbi:permease [Actinomadura macrotermitis]|uniref:Putative two-component membrane permease complex subunit n=1 Tax=Actinomadura macrotermitis TaxID=2585200 RepID=A0A7K0BWP4_9ACTN|nr:putative two-component membrane permease complex subunit [Actinomadura macrotermitis]